MRKAIKFLLKFLKQIRSASVVAVILLILIVIAAGLYLQWPMGRIILAVLAIISISVVIAIIRRLRSQKGSQAIEKSLKSQSAVGKEEDIEQLRQHISSALEALKKSKLRKGITGQSALYELPWYMFIGPPGAGKTTAIENSGLEFPYGTERIRGVGGTRNCDWFFSNSAIFLDTAGRYTTEEDDREEWFAFLDILKKNRKKRPINGVIIGISITDIMSGSVDDLEQAAKTIRDRIDELTEQLGVRYPVYILFTKCDLIRGFVEFFEDMSKVDREQIWGSTFTKEQRKNPDISEVFLTEFQKLHDALLRSRIDRLNSPMNRQTRQRVYTFPVEFLGLRDQLDIFISKLFHPNPYKESPLFRGFYFTSGTQEGVPIDRVIQSIAQQFQLPQEDVQSFDPEMEKKSYFIKDLFTDVVVPDQEMVARTRKSADKYGAMKIGIFGAAIVLLGVFFLGVSSTHLKFKRDSRQLLSSARNVEQISWDDDSFSQNFYQLDEFRQEINQVDRAGFLTKGIYKGSQVVEPAKQLYYAKLKPFITTYLYDGYLREELERFIQGNPAVHRERAYNLLRAYMLLGSERQRVNDSRVEREFLYSQVGSLVDSLLQSRFNFAYQADHNENLADVRSVIQDQVEYFVDIYANPPNPGQGFSGITGFETNQNLVSRSRTTLGTPDISDVYARIQREAAVETIPLTLSEIVGERNMEYFTDDARISGFYTIEGYNSYVTDKIQNASQTPGENDWVLAIDASQLPEEMQDQAAMEADLMQLYYQDYVSAWRNYLASMRLTGFGDMSSASEQLQVLGNFEDSPIRMLLEMVSEQTQFESAIGRSARGIGERIGIEGNVHPIDQEFTALHNLADEENTDLANVLGQYELISSVMNTLAREPNSESAGYAATILQQRSGEFPEALRNIRRSLVGIDNQLQDALFTRPIFLSWSLILGRANAYLNTVWEDQVYETYQAALAPHYPFNQSSSTDAPIADVVNFFNNSDGILWDFVDNELGPFIRDNSYNAAVWEGRGIAVSTQLKNALNKSSEISRGLNLQSSGNLNISFSLLPELPTPSGTVEQITLAIDGNSIIYRMGRPRWTEFTWPGPQNAAGAHLEIQANQGSYNPLSFSSLWGWFRLLERADIQRESASNYILEWEFNGTGGQTVLVTFDLRTASIYHPFGSDGFFALTLPRTLN